LKNKKTLTQNQTNVFLLPKFGQNTKNQIGKRMVFYRHILVFSDFFFPNFEKKNNSPLLHSDF